jgi:NTE family protein
MESATQTPHIFQDLPSELVAEALTQCEERTFPAGSTVIEEGDTPEEILLITAGIGEILVRDSEGNPRCVARLASGATIGEMSFLSGRPASATVRAAGDLQVRILRQDDFVRLAATAPRIYRNIGAIIADRLIRTNRLAFRSPGQLTALLDFDSPPLLGYALASSLAWHVRKPVLLLVVTDREPAEPLQTLLASAGDGQPPGPETLPRAVVRLAETSGGLDAGHLEITIDELRMVYDHVLVQLDPSQHLSVPFDRHVALTGGTIPAAAVRDAGHCVVSGWSRNGSPPRPDDAGVLHVPPLSSAEQRELASGLLSTAGAAGKVLGWAARDVCAKKVGLALGAGLERGYAHIGVLKALERIGLEPDFRAGTSIGAIVLGMRSVGYSFEECARQMDEVGTMLFRPTIPTSSFLSNRGLRAGLQRLGISARIEDQEPPLAIVAADLRTQREVVLRRGLLWQACLASCALPGVYPPQMIGEYALVDGGALNPVPTNIAAHMGADVVIAVRLASSVLPPPVEAEATPSHGKCPWALQTILRAIDLMYAKIETVGGDAATITIDPRFTAGTGGGIRQFSAGRRHIELGEAAAEAALPRLREAFPWLRN